MRAQLRKPEADNLRQNLRADMQRQGISMSAYSKRLGVISSTHLRKFLSEQSAFSKAMANLISAATNKPMEWWLSDHTNETSGEVAPYIATENTPKQEEKKMEIYHTGTRAVFNTRMKTLMTQLRERMNYRHDDLAGMLGTDAETVRCWEVGKGTPTAYDLVKILELTGLPLEYAMEQITAPNSVPVALPKSKTVWEI